MSGSGQIISLTDVCCVRGGRTLFSGLSFALSSGEAAIVTGPNGVGKSTLLRLICGLFDPGNAGIAVHGGCALSDDRLALDEARSLHSALSFWANADGGDAGGGDVGGGDVGGGDVGGGDVGGGDLDRALEAVGLSHLSEVPVRILSTGQRKRASLARVLASNAPIWLLDEPANGLDGDGLNRLMKAVADHRARGGVAVITSHQPLAIPDAISVQLEPSAS